MRILLFLILLVLPTIALPQTEIPKALQSFKAELLKPEQLGEGFFAMSKSDYKTLENNNDVKLIRRLESDYVIVHISASEKSNFTTIYSLNNNWKLSPKLQTKNFGKDKLKLSIATINSELFLQDLKKLNISFDVLLEQSQLIYISADAKDIFKILGSEYCKYIDHIPNLQTEANIIGMDLSVNQINMVHQLFPETMGEGINVSIKEEKFNIDDIDIKNRYFFNGTESANTSSHATLMATLIAGAGNNSKESLGILPKAEVSSSDFVTLLPDDADIYQSDKLFIQNHSYGTSELENYYGSQAKAFDESVLATPKLLHVFSSGNKGNEAISSGNYADIPGYSNFTGNFKMAKNVLVIGGINRDLTSPTLSSKGPTEDGRLKPDLVAYGPEGTSDAAATVSGVAGLLQQTYYKDYNEIPKSNLVKSILIAAADDVLSDGPDYVSGFGNVNASQSLEVIQKNQYYQDNLMGSEIKTYSITIPDNTENVRIALSWNDLPANEGDAKVLINDLDLTVTNNGMVYKPWILSTYPALDSLAKPARRGIDHVNTAELITLENPTAGQYDIQIKANDFTGNQSFAIAYYIEKGGSFTWQYPALYEQLDNSATQYLRWNNTTENASGSLEIKLEDGDWQSLQTNVDLTKEYVEWLPGNFSGTAELRMKINSTYVTADPFIISAQPRLKIDYNCEDKIGLSWEEIPNATAYVIKQLGNKYLEEFTSSSTTSVEILKSELSSPYISLSALFDGLESVPSPTIDYNLQGIKCYYINFYAYLNEEEAVETTLNLSTLNNISEVVITKISEDGELILSTVTSPETVINYIDSSTDSGDFLYGATIVLTDGTEIETDKVNILIPGQKDFKIFPNPTTLEYGIGVESKGNQIEFQLVDLTGRIVLKSLLERREEYIDLPVISKGLYIARILKDGKLLNSKKIIIYN